ncbi:MAG: fumarylacetoacetate hydrolase family protein [Geminicoccaceae bacterium]|nr:fumarylacetoacetate hydrolase family protein [Geminicoccaceae bacterium]MCX8101280.1 fumarylacetoacetate hydrolase family protein [Geminicoccaceae bacterium]MDW8370750.1 fumarylacetoacetate hydrolase family protein [Geminicoccaceae bacterium]
MKLATLAEGGRDGRLVLVTRDLARAVRARAATTMLEAMDRWAEVEPQLRAEAEALERGRAQDAFPFDPRACAAPFPRTWQWADGSAYLNHVELVRRARGAAMPPSFLTDPLLYQGGSDRFLAPCEPIPLIDQAHGLDFEAEVAVVTGDVPMAASIEEARAAIRLVLLVNDVSLRNLIPDELAKGFGFFNSKPASALSPVAVTLDELGPRWDGDRVHGAVRCTLDGELFGTPDAGVDMQFGFPELIAHAAKTRSLAAGTILGGGTISNRQGGLFGSSVANGGVGYACIAELRMYEAIETGAPRTPFMRAGSRIRIEMLDEEGRSIFGAIDQEVVRFERTMR